MADVRWSGIRLTGLWAAVPSARGTTADLTLRFGAVEARRIAENTGVLERRLAPPGVCASDLCFEAAANLLRSLAWDPKSVDALVFVSQTPDFALPATACCLQHRLGLPTGCAAFDVQLGCSGYVYGLWLSGSLLRSGAARRVLLLVGDTMSQLLGPSDRATVPLFGDAGTATALEAAPDDGHAWTINLGTDGAGFAHLNVPGGRFRHPTSEASRARTEREAGNIRSDEDLFMNGAEVFAFTLREVPRLVKGILSASGRTAAEVDHFVFHQANGFMLRTLAKKIGLPADKLVLGLKRYGNTSSGSIPLAMVTELEARLRSGPATLLLAGFGVGWSWGAAVIETPALLSIGFTEFEP
ncbi:MAG: fabH 2 [candidate division NC10 bacterium]|nr:fabH 2 [candidate division NC10 bacterium]